ncbi:hypothetical protein CYMTET_41580 [Cymbomonas tetramitiformis]|uniref:Uncharacterized protein n=1 Tax=Cymbomonas tetramitiformis TaxID=36881 RepID=A0AAE0C7Y8_9CHLO|nr:hypothetical protein CYMTET_41580 [Cymbomonas tetramitiformis]
MFTAWIVPYVEPNSVKTTDASEDNVATMASADDVAVLGKYTVEPTNTLPPVMLVMLTSEVLTAAAAAIWDTYDARKDAEKVASSKAERASSGKATVEMTVSTVTVAGKEEEGGGGSWLGSGGGGGNGGGGGGHGGAAEEGTVEAAEEDIVEAAEEGHGGRGGGHSGGGEEGHGGDGGTEITVRLPVRTW